jgi:hypothetical protein
MKLILCRFVRTLSVPAIAGLLFMSGCASPAQSSAMVATPVGSVTKHVQSVSMNVTGGSETSAAMASQISSTDFAAALKQSIEQSGLFAKVEPNGGSDDYHLEVAIVRLQQPMFGLNMTVVIETNWTLTRQNDHYTVWQKAIVTSHTAKTGEAFAGVKRLRLANEGAARDNIHDALTQLAALTLL